MTTFYEVKSFICKLFGHEDVEEGEDDVNIEVWDKMRNVKWNFILVNDELRKIYNSICVREGNGVEFFCNKIMRLP